MPYYHNMIGGPSDVEGAEDVELTLKKEDDSQEVLTLWNTPAMMEHRGSWLPDGVTFVSDGHTEGNSLN